MAKILVAEYEPIVRKTIATVLAKFGYDVATAANGEEALETISRESLDLVLLDGTMGKGASGIDTCKKIRQNYSKEDLPIIGMSGWGEAYREKYREAGANDYLPKPFNIDDLRRTIMRNTIKK